jgi:hypothetical protein
MRFNFIAARLQALAPSLIALNQDLGLPEVAVDISLSPSETLCESNSPKRKAQKLSTGRKYALLALFCIAQLIDVFNNSAVISALPTIVASLDMTDNESTWVVSAFQLTFASFLLVVSVMLIKSRG